MNVCGCGRLRVRFGLRLSHLQAAQYNSDTARPTRTHGILKHQSTNITSAISGYRQFSNRGPRMSDTQKWTATVVRKTFLEFFEKNGHTVGM
jgi:hypothetical protein